MLVLLALLVLDVSVSAQFPAPWGEPLTLRGAASFCLDFAPRPEVVDGVWQRPEWPWKTLPASDSAGAGGDCSLSGRGRETVHRLYAADPWSASARRLRPGARKAVVPAQSVMRKNCAST